MDKDHATTEVLKEVGAERQRQIEELGYSPERDDYWNASGSLAGAAAVYASYATSDARHMAAKKFLAQGLAPNSWPWDSSFWKPTTRRRDLVKAAALIVAEIERLDRLGPESDA